MDHAIRTVQRRGYQRQTWTDDEPAALAARFFERQRSFPGRSRSRSVAVVVETNDHLFIDSSLPSYDDEATALVLERSKSCLDRLGVRTAGR